MMLCPDINASSRKAEESPAVKMVTSNKNAKRLEGGMLKMAKPFLKKTPISIVMDDIEMMVICPLENEDDGFTEKAEKMLGSYMKVYEIDDEFNRMYIYIDAPQNESFTELIIHYTRPEKSILVFEGDFTVESLKKVGELSKQQRQQKRQSKR